MKHRYFITTICHKYVTISRCRRVLGREGECAPLGKMDQYGHGIVYSTFATTRIFYWAMEMITGDRKRSSNPFFWDVVIQNPPETTSYDPTMSRLYIWDSTRGVIRSACKTYVNVLRYIAANHSLAKEATHQVETAMGYLGM